MEHKLYQILVVLLLCLCPLTFIPGAPNSPPLLAGAQNCPPRPVPTPGAVSPHRHGALGPFISSAKFTREAILGQELPYSAIREEIRTQ